ncbi:HlyD family efflux transporter periplasmic adaptor subunit [bacterium]|nr:HlyD family efflux transporter periplasmic adaptor subunit [bacterium]
MSSSQNRRRVWVTWLRRGAVIAALLGVAGLIIYAFLPPVLAVDMAEVTKGPMRVDVREEGKTRIKERYVVSSPLAGRVLRIELKPGDEVIAGETLLATIEPADPSLLDARALATAQAKVQAGEANRQRAVAELNRAEAAHNRADAQYKRIRSLRETGSASTEQLEDAELNMRANSEQLTAAKFNVNIADFELEQAKAALLRFDPNPQTAKSPDSTPSEWRMQIHSPISGRVLAVYQESSAVVTPGTSLVAVGDPKDLEVVVDVLSEDAVKVRSGNEVDIAQWGGGDILKGRVRRIEPQAFTKVSALGVEEQRVNIIVDFADPVEKRQALGDQYRIEAEIVIWKGEDIVQVPVSCLFRRNDQWSVFIVKDGVADLRQIEIGERNTLQAQVLKGLEPGEKVIIHPGDQIKSGAKVEARD